MAKKFELNEMEFWDGNYAASQALRQAQVDVVAAYPITPSTPIVENYGAYQANGYIDGEFVMVESEHAAMSGCVGLLLLVAELQLLQVLKDLHLWQRFYTKQVV